MGKVHHQSLLQLPFPPPYSPFHPLKIFFFSTFFLRFSPSGPSFGLLTLSLTKLSMAPNLRPTPVCLAISFSSSFCEGYGFVLIHLVNSTIAPPHHHPPQHFFYHASSSSFYLFCSRYQILLPPHHLHQDSYFLPSQYFFVFDRTFCY